MSTISEKLLELAAIKAAIKQALINKGENPGDDMSNYPAVVATASFPEEQLWGSSATITTNVTYGSYTGDTTIDNVATVTLVANQGYNLPLEITVVGATYSYNNLTGVINLSDPTSNVTITAVCSNYEEPTQEGDKLTITQCMSITQNNNTLEVE